MNILDHPAYAYAQGVVNGTIVAPKYVKKQCKLFLDELANENSKYFINEDKLKMITNLTGLVNMPTGLRTGIPAKEALVGFQWFLIVNVLCWYHKDKKNKRRYEKAVLLIARKSGKSFLVALIIILLMLTEPEFSEFYSVAPTRELSSIIKKEISNMLNTSHSKLKEQFKTVLSETRCNLTKSKFTPLATSDNRMDGRLATAFIADEVGALRTNYPIEAMESSQMNLTNRLGLLISTAYDSTNNPMTEEVEYAQKVLDEIVEDETLFSLLYMPDDMKNWTTDEALLQANPLAIDLPENLEILKKKRATAIEMPSKQTNFKTKHLNIFVDGDVADVYIATDDLKKCKIKEYDWTGRRVYVGVDLSASDDNTAVSMITYDEELDKYFSKVWAFYPAENIEVKSAKEKIDYRQMERFGLAYGCGDRIISYKFVEDFVANLENQYGVKIDGIAYDRWNAISSANRWHELGYNVIEIKQHSAILHPATKLLKEMVLTEKFAYENNMLFEINVSNAREVLDTNLNGYVNKKKSKGKIDMLAATINAMVMWNMERIEVQGVAEIVVF